MYLASLIRDVVRRAEDFIRAGGDDMNFGVRIERDSEGRSTGIDHFAVGLRSLGLKVINGIPRGLSPHRIFLRR